MRPQSIFSFLVPSLMAVACAGEATPTPTTPAVVEPKAEAPVATKPVKTYRWVEGPLARIYIISGQADGTGKAVGWPPASLPEAPVAVVSDLVELPQVPKSGPQKAGDEQGLPNRLLPLSVVPQLKWSLFYAIQYEGAFWAEERGKYGISISADDPFSVEFQANADSGWKTVAKSSWSLPLDRAPNSYDLGFTWKYALGGNVGVIEPRLPKEIEVQTAVIDVPVDRVYVPIRINLYQRWLIRPSEMPADIGGVDQAAVWSRYAGAVFTAAFTTPSGSEELRLFRKEKIRQASTRPTEE